MVRVSQRARAPTPAAYAPREPLLVTCPPPLPAHAPVRAPVVLSSSSPELGIDHVSPGGNSALIAVKKVTQSETFGDATP
jgi:hypothetical protein